MTDYSTQQCCHAEFLFKLFGNGKQKGASENINLYITVEIYEKVFIQQNLLILYEQHSY